MAGRQDPDRKEEAVVGAGQEPQADFDYPDEGEDGLYGWKFHRGPLLLAIILTVIFYIFVFVWVD